MPLPILHTINPGGTPHGISTYSSYLGCPRKAYLDEMKRREEREEEKYEGLQGSSGAVIGTIGHSLLELYFKGTLPSGDVAVEYSHVLDDAGRVEAERCFRAFTKAFQSKDVFGEPLAVELAIEEGNKDVERVIGIAPFTGRLDLVTRMSSNDVARINRMGIVSGAVEALAPGRWIIDHKFFKSEDRHLTEKALWSLQYTAYQLAYEAMTGEQVMGVIQNTIIRRKKVGFKWVVVPPPTLHDIRRLHNALSTAYAKREKACNSATIDEVEAIPKPDYCFSWGRECLWKTKRLCRGY